MKFFSEDIELLKAFNKQRTICLYALHQKYNLSPAQLARSVRKLEELNVIRSIDKNKIEISEYGKAWIIRNRKTIFLTEKDKYWKAIPDHMTNDQIDINQLYAPNRKKISPELFKLNEGR